MPNFRTGANGQPVQVCPDCWQPLALAQPGCSNHDFHYEIAYLKQDLREHRAYCASRGEVTRLRRVEDALTEAGYPGGSQVAWIQDRMSELAALKANAVVLPDDWVARLANHFPGPDKYGLNGLVNEVESWRGEAKQDDSPDCTSTYHDGAVACTQRAEPPDHLHRGGDYFWSDNASDQAVAKMSPEAQKIANTLRGITAPPKPKQDEPDTAPVCPQHGPHPHRGGLVCARCAACGPDKINAAHDMSDLVRTNPDEPGQPTEPQICGRCHGCKQLANTPDREPWSAWENLPFESQAAIRLGIVHPITCDHCHGTGTEPAKPARPADA